MNEHRKFAFGLRLLIIFAVSLLLFLGYRLIKYQRDEPIREGISAWKAGDASTAIKMLTPFAERGNELARRTMGEIYTYGEGISADPIQAGIWFRRAECACEMTGEYEYAVAMNFLNGRAPGPKAQDLTAARVWLQRAAEAGHTEAQRVLANPNALSQKGVVISTEVSEYWKRFLPQ
jgi:TPR repeat protein